jgi:hypothetical protein
MRSAREIAQGETMHNGVWMISRLPLAAALLALPAYAADVNT